jgi:hypothetical protein
MDDNAVHNRRSSSMMSIVRPHLHHFSHLARRSNVVVPDTGQKAL